MEKRTLILAMAIVCGSALIATAVATKKSSFERCYDLAYSVYSNVANDRQRQLGSITTCAGYQRN